MDARLLRASLMLAVVWIAGVGSAQGVNHAAVVRTGAVGGSCRSQNFVVTAPTPAFARQVCEAAEHYRRVLAVEWLGAELPPWPLKNTSRRAGVVATHRPMSSSTLSNVSADSQIVPADHACSFDFV